MKRCSRLLFLATIPAAAAAYISLVHSLPAWVHLAGGALGAGWWVCRYAVWRHWESHKAAMRQARK